MAGLDQAQDPPDRPLARTAGFKPGERVQVTCLAPGLLELRAPEPLTLREDVLTEADLVEGPF